MKNKRKSLVLAFILIVFVSGGLAIRSTMKSRAQVLKLDLSSYEFNSAEPDMPIREDNLLVFGVRVNEISSSLNKAIKRDKLDLLPVKFFDINKSCGELKDWFYIDRNFNLTIIFLCRDLSNKLTKDEIMAYSVHEIAHIVLGHAEFFSPALPHTRNIIHEQEADDLAVRSGISPSLLMSAINKLSADNQEKDQRIKTLEALISNPATS